MVPGRNTFAEYRAAYEANPTLQNLGVRHSHVQLISSSVGVLFS